MKTDVIAVSSQGAGMNAALDQVEKVSAYKGLSSRNTLHLRLLTEEMMGMMRSITGETRALFWIEDQNNVYELHLQVRTAMDPEKREQLLAASSTGKNEAARGLMGRLRDFFEQGGDLPSLYLYAPEVGEYAFSSPAPDLEWTMSAYQRQLEHWISEDPKARAMWDELEKSVVTHVADDIRVSIRGDLAELMIVKEMKQA